MTDAPCDDGGAALLATLPASSLDLGREDRVLPWEEDRREEDRKRTQQEREELQKTLEEEAAALATYLLTGAPEDQNTANRLAELSRVLTRPPPPVRPSRPAALSAAKRPAAAAPNKERNRGILFDTAAGASSVPLKKAAGRKPLEGVAGPALENASGAPVQSNGEVYSLNAHTGAKLPPTKCVAADAVTVDQSSELSVGQ